MPFGTNSSTTSDGLRNFSWRSSYESSDGDLVADFYVPALQRSVSYMRAVGYFKSSIFLLTGPECARFALTGGQMSVVCSPEISGEDHTAIQEGGPLAEISRSAARRELEGLMRTKDSSQHIRTFAALVAFGCLEIRFVLSTHGIFHDKFGVFTDAQGDSISFRGSSNESWSAWSPWGNQEGFEVFTGWSHDRSRVKDHLESFGSIWEGKRNNLRTLSLPNALLEGVLGQMPQNIDEAEAILLERAAADVQQHGSSTSVEFGSAIETPRRTLRPHQIAVLEDWNRAGRRGIVAHATGSGKTVTAIEAARQWLSSGGTVVVLVPSQLLLEQWLREVDEFLAEIDLIRVVAGGGFTDWKKDGALRIATRDDSRPAVILSTFATATKSEFVSGLQTGDHVLCIADEVHGLGAQGFGDLLLINCGAMLGLSATPDRYGDPEGTARLREAFGPDLEPNYGIAEALAEGTLCPYTYFPRFVHLSDDEEAAWARITQRITSLLQQESDQGLDAVSQAELQRLFIARARVAKKAQAKMPESLRILEEHYQLGHSWLVYAEDREQVTSIVQQLKSLGIKDLFEYHTAMAGDRRATMESFRRRRGVLVAIRCLDEGVDLPEVSHALILASSRNPREFIQRRGRVLRTAEGKESATIFDVLVAPPEHGLSEGFALAELSRALEFATHADNSDAELVVEEIARDWGIQPEMLQEFSMYGEEEGPMTPSDEKFSRDVRKDRR